MSPGVCRACRFRAGFERYQGVARRFPGACNCQGGRCLPLQPRPEERRRRRRVSKDAPVRAGTSFETPPRIEVRGSRAPQDEVRGTGHTSLGDTGACLSRRARRPRHRADLAKSRGVCRACRFRAGFERYQGVARRFPGACRFRRAHPPRHRVDLAKSPGVCRARHFRSGFERYQRLAAVFPGG